jgi:hypothetical protein
MARSMVVSMVRRGSQSFFLACQNMHFTKLQRSNRKKKREELNLNTWRNVIPAEIYAGAFHFPSVRAHLNQLEPTLPEIHLCIEKETVNVDNKHRFFIC